MAKIRIRNPGNTAWVEIGVGDLDRRILSLKGLVVNEDGDAVDTRIEGNTESDLFVVDASEDAIYLGGITNGVKIEKGGKISLLGTATIWDDASYALIGQKLETPGSHIVVNVAEAALTFKTTATTVDYVYMNIQVPHRWKPGSKFYPHIHWWQTHASVPAWRIEYRWQINGAAKTTAWTALSRDHEEYTYVSGTLNQITEFSSAGVSPPNGYTMSDNLQLRLERDGNSDPAGAPQSDVVAFDPHFEFDSLGSNDEYTK